MSKTHLAVGMAAAMAVASVNGFADCALALAGGALGGVIADADILDNDYKKDALIGELIAVGIVAIVSVLDFFLNWGMCSYIATNKFLPIAGGVGFMVLWIISFFTSHRTFTHSLLSMILFSACIFAIYPKVGLIFLTAYFSHIFIDMFNKKDVQILFPLKRGFCFKLIYANSAANTVIMWIGFGITLLLIILKLFVLKK